MYTTHGLMTPADLADYRDLYDLDCDRPECTSCGEQLTADGNCPDDCERVQ